MENKTIGIVISAAIAILMGAILISILADQIAPRTSEVTYTETVDISSLRNLAGGGFNYSVDYRLYAQTALDHAASAGWQTDYPDCAISTITLYNQTGGLLSNADDYTWVEDGNGIQGWLRIKNTLNVNQSASNLTTVVYTGCPDDYVAESWQRTILGLVLGFFALALLIVAAIVIMWVLRIEGVDMEI